MAIPTDYRVVVDVTSFEAGPDGTVALDARWLLIETDETQGHFMHDSCIRKSAADVGDYSALVSAKNDALADLSREIAQAIKALQAKASGDE